MRRLQIVSFSLLLAAAYANSTTLYQVTLLADEGKISVDACLSADATKLVVGNKRASRYVATSVESNLVQTRSSLHIVNKTNPCFNYTVDLHKARKDRFAYQVGKSWLVNNHSWLWLPDTNQPVHANFREENGNPVKLSAPWRIKNGGYHLNETPIHWTSRIAFGDIDIVPTNVGKSVLNVALLNIQQAQKRSELVNWVGSAGRAVASVYGRYPLTDVQVLVVPIGKRKEAVPWAEVQRNGHPAVHFFIDPNRPIEQFHADWTATHELSHLLHPRIEYQDRWLSEGLASYYQYIVQARAGMLTNQQAWKKFTAGLERGRKKADRPLRSAKQTRHAYWGGAAIYFLADIELRKSSTGQSLNEVLDKFASLHLPSNKLWSAEQYMQTLDEISQTKIFTTLLAKEATQLTFPIRRADEPAFAPSQNTITADILGGN